MDRLKNKIAVITGGGGGIGRTAVDIFSREGATVIILELNREWGEKARDEVAERFESIEKRKSEAKAHERNKRNGKRRTNI